MLLVSTGLWLIAVVFVVPNETSSYSYSYSRWNMLAMNIKAVMVQWFIQQSETQQNLDFDMNLARQDMRPGWSPWTEEGGARAHRAAGYVVTVGPYYVLPTALWAWVVVSLMMKRKRRAFSIITATALIVLVLAFYERPVVDALFPGTHAFLEDYCFVPGLDLTGGSAPRGKTIAVYDKKSFERRGRRLIAFADGHAEFLWDDRAKPLFEAQGLEYPVKPEDYVEN